MTMDFRKKYDEAYCTFRETHGDEWTISYADLIKFDAPTPQDKDTWGEWVYDAKWLTLTYIPEDYEIDLEDCTTSAQTLDWIFQITKKTWSSPEMIGHLVQALEDLLDPQANLCSFGQDKTFVPHKYLRKLS